MTKKITKKKVIKKAAKKVVKKATPKKIIKASPKKTVKKVVKKVVKKKTAKSASKKVVKKAKKVKTAKKTVKKAVVTTKTAKKAVKRASSAKQSSTVIIPKPKIAKTWLSAAQLKVFRATLMAKRHELIGDMTGIEANALAGAGFGDGGDSHNMPTHPADVGSDNFEQDFTLGLIESEQAMLGEIYEALERIKNKSFGICLGTGKRIAMPRLRAVPWSKYSIDYQRKIERGIVRE